MVLHKHFEEHDVVVDRLNNIETKSWTAGISDNFSKLNLAQINKHAGRTKNKSRKSFVQVKNKSQSKNKEDYDD